jgi:hypothetical protein
MTNPSADGRLKRRGKWSTLSDEEYDRHWVARVKAACDITPEGCWIWRGHTYHNGYGMTSYRGKNVIVHRKMHEAVNRVKLERWVYACHSCDIKLCCNPEHVWAGTPKENSIDSAKKLRHQENRKTHCDRGHPFEGENLIMRKQAKGKGDGMRRVCRACERIRARLALGWTLEQAMALPITPPGHRPVAGRRAA